MCYSRAVAGRPSKLTEEVAKRILANFRQGGRLIYAAARQGVSRSMLFSRLKRGERESSGPYQCFSRGVNLIAEERIASLALRNHRLATGCVMGLPARDSPAACAVTLRASRSSRAWHSDRTVAPCSGSSSGWTLTPTILGRPG